LLLLIVNLTVLVSEGTVFIDGIWAIDVVTDKVAKVDEWTSRASALFGMNSELSFAFAAHSTGVLAFTEDLVTKKANCRVRRTGVALLTLSLVVLHHKSIEIVIECCEAEVIVWTEKE
jgi:hypothetical protein